jgi:ribokinase
LKTVQKAAELAKASSALFILNPAPARTLPEHLLKQVDFLTPNETELEILSGESVKDVESAKAAATNLLNKGVKNVIIALGEKGALLVNNNQEQLFPTRKIMPVDTTAAGDAFNGALALLLARGEEIAAAIQFANQVASFSVTRMGAQNSVPTRDEIEEWINK